MRNKAQSTLEYAVLFAVIVAALVGMQVYLKRGMQGRLKGYAEQLTQGAAYSPGATSAFSGVATFIQEDSATLSDNSVLNNSVPNSTSRSTSNVTKGEYTLKIGNTLSFDDEPRRW